MEHGTQFTNTNGILAIQHGQKHENIRVCLSRCRFRLKTIFFKKSFEPGFELATTGSEVRGLNHYATESNENSAVISVFQIKSSIMLSSVDIKVDISNIKRQTKQTMVILKQTAANT